MKVGLCTISSKDRSVGDVLELAGEVGYDGVEVWGREHVGDGSEETCKRIADTAADYGLDVAAYGSYLRCGSDGFADEFEHELAVTARLGAECIRVWAGSQEYGSHDDEHLERVVSDLRTLTDHATEHGIKVTVEKHPNTLTQSLAGARRVVEAIDSDACGLNYQPGYGIPAEELEGEASELAPLTNQLHLQGPATRSGQERAPLADVYYDLESVLEPFCRRGFDGYANVEFVTEQRPYREAIEADLRSVRAIVD